MRYASSPVIPEPTSYKSVLGLLIAQIRIHNEMPLNVVRYQVDHNNLEEMYGTPRFASEKSTITELLCANVFRVYLRLKLVPALR